MAQQTTLFGTVVEKGQLFKGLPNADDDTEYCYAVVFTVCVLSNFRPTKQGWGVSMGNSEKLTN